MFLRRAARPVTRTCAAHIAGLTANQAPLSTAITATLTAARAVTLPTAAGQGHARLTRRSATTWYIAMASGGGVPQPIQSLTALTTRCTVALPTSPTTGEEAATNARKALLTSVAGAAGGNAPTAVFLCANQMGKERAAQAAIQTIAGLTTFAGRRAGCVGSQ